MNRWFVITNTNLASKLLLQIRIDSNFVFHRVFHTKRWTLWHKKRGKWSPLRYTCTVQYKCKYRLGICSKLLPSSGKIGVTFSPKVIETCTWKLFSKRCLYFKFGSACMLNNLNAKIILTYFGCEHELYGYKICIFCWSI